MSLRQEDGLLLVSWLGCGTLGTWRWQAPGTEDAARGGGCGSGRTAEGHSAPLPLSPHIDQFPTSGHTLEAIISLSVY